eukprot:1004681_1
MDLGNIPSMDRPRRSSAHSCSSIGSEANEFLLSKSDLAENTLVKDITIDWIYNPRSLSAMVVVLCTLMYFGINETSENHTVSENVVRGLCVAIFAFLVIGLLVFPSGPFTRPHPALWRLVFGVSCVYLMALIIVLFQNISDARNMLKVFGDEIGEPIDEFVYADNCAFTWGNFKVLLYDRFVLSHFLGFFAKAVMIRDRCILWTNSIVWEFFEIICTYGMPHIAECWWDQWILDVLLSNGLGIEFGIFVCKKLEAKEYRWSGIVQIPSIFGRIKRCVLQFSPESWTVVRWHKISSVKRFLVANFIVFVFLIVEMNGFTLISALLIPEGHNLNVYRLLVWFGMGLVSLRQFYVYLVDPRCKRLGTQTIVCIATVVTETLISYKFIYHTLPPMPRSTFNLIVTVLSIYFSGSILLLMRQSKVYSDKKYE